MKLHAVLRSAVSRQSEETIIRIKDLKIIQANLDHTTRNTVCDKIQLSFGIVDILQKPASGKTVSFFYITSNGAANVRKSTDYIAEMISLAGGKYIFDDLTDDTAKSTVNMQMESFYAGAKDADVMIYNATIDSPIQSLDELIAKNDLFSDFKAVQDGNVWCVGKYMYQATDIVGQLITDFHLMLTGGDEKDMTFLTKVN